jgi:predicted Zn-dependent protease
MTKRNGLFLLVGMLVLAACGLVNKENKGQGFNLFPVTKDIELGAQVAAQIDSNTAEYPLLDSVQYKEVYAYVYKVRDKILNTGNVKHKDDFVWRLRIIHDDSTLNAFCTPGGYIYIYTGILKFLESEDEFAGVLGHEIAHADLRHSTRQMTKLYGVQILLDVAAGNRDAIKQVASGLVGLKFSRGHESEADQKSVEYLCPTDYNAAGGSGFFKKIQEMGGSKTPAFLSTHPDPGDRVEHFESEKLTQGCTGIKLYKTEFETMLSKLPK